MDITELNKKGIVGYLYGFDEYSTDTTASADGGNQKEYTTVEIVSMIKDLKATLNKQHIEDLLLWLEQHVQDVNNPHNLTLESLGTSVMDEAYKAWKKDGNVGTIEDFTKVLFQFIQIASVDETLNDRDNDEKVVSVKGAKAFYENHINDENAHGELFRKVFPGKPIKQLPDYTALAECDLATWSTIERSSESYFHDQYGYLDKIGNNKLAIDHINGYPAYSIFEQRTNLITNSLTLSTGNYIGVNTVGTKQIPGIVKDQEVTVVRETNSGITERHGYNTGNVINIEANKVYTVSIYAYVLDRKYFCIKIPSELNNDSFIVHNLKDKDHKHKNNSYDESINSYDMWQLPNGWVRVAHTFVAQATGRYSFECVFCDIVDGDTTYVGDTTKVPGALQQIQIEVGKNASPPILTGDTIVTREATKAVVDMKELFDIGKGTFVISSQVPNGINDAIEHHLYDVGNASKTVIRGYYPTNTPSKLHIESFNKYGLEVDSHTMDDTPRDKTTYCYSYGDERHVYDKNGDPVQANFVIDNSIGFSESIENTLVNIFKHKTKAGRTYLIDYVNSLRETNYSVEDLTTTELLESMLLHVSDKIGLENEADKEVAYIDLREDSDFNENILLDGDVDYLYLGSDRTQSKFINGYVSEFTFYRRYSDQLETEFLTGEYNGR